MGRHKVAMGRCAIGRAEREGREEPEGPEGPEEPGGPGGPEGPGGDGSGKKVGRSPLGKIIVFFRCSLLKLERIRCEQMSVYKEVCIVPTLEQLIWIRIVYITRNLIACIRR